MQVDREIYNIHITYSIIYIHIEWSGQASGTCKCVSIVAVWSPFSLDSLWPGRATWTLQPKCRRVWAVRAVLAVLLHAWLQCVHCQVLFSHSRLSEVWIDSFVLVKVGHWEFPILIGHNQIKEKLNDSRVQGRLGCSFLRKPFSSWHHHSEFLLRSVVYWCTLVAGFPQGLSENMVPLNPLVYHHCSIQIAIVRHT